MTARCKECGARAVAEPVDSREGPWVVYCSCGCADQEAAGDSCDDALALWNKLNGKVEDAKPCACGAGDELFTKLLIESLWSKVFTIILLALWCALTCWLVIDNGDMRAELAQHKDKAEATQEEDG